MFYSRDTNPTSSISNMTAIFFKQMLKHQEDKNEIHLSNFIKLHAIFNFLKKIYCYFYVYSKQSKWKEKILTKNYANKIFITSFSSLSLCIITICI